MKKQLLFLVAAFSISLLSKAQVIFTESFESATFPPPGWNIFNNGTGNDWALNDMNPAGASQGVQSMYYEYSSSDPADAWAFTPGIPLMAGDSIVISFDCIVASADYPESMKLTVGNGQNVAAQTTVLWDEDSLINETFQTISVGYLVGSSGTFNLGFNCYSQADMYLLSVDNIKVRKVLASDLQMNTYTGTTRSCSFSSGEEIMVNFSNIGAADEVNFPVAYSINGVVTFENVSTPVPAGTSFAYIFNAGADFSTPGTYYVKIYTQLAADGDRSNDTVSFVVTSDPSGLMMKTSIDTSFIPDNDPAGVISELPFCGIANNLGTNIRIKRLTIESIAHTYPDDLTLRLISPLGDSLTLAFEIGADNPDYPMLTFTDTALTNIIVFDEAPILTGYYHTQDSIGFAKFNGQDPNGPWRLMISDGYAEDAGYLTSWTLEFDNAVGIKELKAVNNLIIVYPNPSNGWCSVRSASKTAVHTEIYSMNGQLLQTVELNGMGTQTIDMRGFAKGMYMVKAITENAVQTSKLIIE
jgi:subtilisin-like proprotein convertase family protein